MKTQNDQATVAPIALLLIAMSTLVFQFFIFGGDFATSTVITSIDAPTCENAGGFLAGTNFIACNIGAFFIMIINGILLIASVVKFLIAGLTFNVPGAPLYARFLVSILYIGAFGMGIAGLFRGVPRGGA